MGKCWLCGADAKKTFSFVRDGLFKDPKGRKYCDDCYKKRLADLTEKKDQYVRLRKYLMLERAVRIFEKQNVDIEDYKDIIDQMEEYVQEFPEKFDSSYEMLAAIVLIHDMVPVTTQYKIGRYRADFYIPDLKVILEIDGDRHEPYRDNQRDIEMRNILGADWEIVRIDTKYLDQNARMLRDAIIAIRNEKQKLRKENYGMLPEWYSKRERAKRKKPKKKIGDDAMFDIKVG